MNAGQQMRWSPDGAHLMLKMLTAVVSGSFDRAHAAAEWRAFARHDVGRGNRVHISGGLY